MRSTRILSALLIVGYILSVNHIIASATSVNETRGRIGNDAISELITLLTELENSTSQSLLKSHFESVRTMIQDDTHDFVWTGQDSVMASQVLTFFQNEGARWETYANGPRPLIMSFKSPSDGKNTFYWLFLPKNFDPENNHYPFYMELHGSGGGKNDNPRNMLFRPLQPEIKGVTSQGYRQEGLFIYPWGRGDKWYQDQAALDIIECLEHFDGLFDTDQSRQYLYGFSMGGVGVYSLSQFTPDRWAAIGIYSGAFRQGVTKEAATSISHLPVWITWGENESLATGNKQLRDYLIEAGAKVKWQQVDGVGHSYLGDYQEDLMNWFLDHTK